MWWLIARPESRLVDLTWLYPTPKLIDLWTHAIVLFELGFPVLDLGAAGPAAAAGNRRARLGVAGAGHRRNYLRH